MVKPLQEDYYPLPIPSDVAGLPRFLEEELERIKNALYAQPVALTVEEQALADVTLLPNWQRLFDGGTTPIWEVPGGNFDNTTGEWTCPRDGLYQAFVSLRVEAFGTGNKSYYAGLRMTKANADGSPNKVIEAADSGVDDFVLTVDLQFQTSVQAGAVLYVEGTSVHDQFTGTTDTTARWQLSRVSA